MKKSIYVILTSILLASCGPIGDAEPRLSIGVGIGNGNSDNGAVGGENSGVRPKLGVSLSLGGSGKETLKMRDGKKSVRPNQLVVLAKDSQNLRNALTASGANVLSSHRLETIGKTMLKLQFPKGTNITAAAQKLRAVGGISSAQPNYIYEAKADINSSFSTIGIEPSTGGRASGILAIIDGMVDTAHTDLSGANIAQSIIAEDAKPTKHGTAVASLLVGNGKVKGVAQGVQLRSFVALQKESGSRLVGETFWIAEAIDQASQSNPKIISLSLGGGARDGLVASVIDAATNKGIVVVAAVGNGGAKGKPSFPASLSNVSGITAVDGNEKLYKYATQGAHVAYASVGVNMIVSVPGGYDKSSGTSMSTAIFAGTLMGLANDAGVTPKSYLSSQISSHVRDLGPEGKDTSFGNGLLVR